MRSLSNIQRCSDWSPFFRLRHGFPFFSITALCLLTLLPGCGGKPAPAPTGTTNTTQQTAATSENGAAQTTAGAGSDNQPRRQNELWKDSAGREYLGDVPLDVFFDQPLTVAGDTTPLAGANVASSGGGEMQMTATVSGGDVPMPAENPADTPTVAATAGGDGWEEMLAMEVLNNEVTSICNFLNGTVNSVGSYNSSMLMIPPKAAAVAVLSAIAIEHPGDLSWKEDAAYIRDLAKRMNEGPLQRGKKDQVRLLELFENMTDTFNRSRPAGLEEPPAGDSFSDVAEMRFVMMRMEEAEKRMKTEAGSESAFGSKKDMIKHEAAILGTLTHIIAREEYGYGDDQEFTGYANKVIEAAKAIRDAADSNDFNSYQLSLSNVSTSCQQCHSVFKNN